MVDMFVCSPIWIWVFFVFHRACNKYADFVDNDFLTYDIRRAAFEVEDFVAKFETPNLQSPGGSITSQGLNSRPVIGAIRGGGVPTVRSTNSVHFPYRACFSFLTDFTVFLRNVVLEKLALHTSCN